jgi:hypothetical protein
MTQPNNPTKIAIIRESGRCRMVTFSVTGCYSDWGRLPDATLDAVAEVADRIRAYKWGCPTVELHDRETDPKLTITTVLQQSTVAP